MGKTKGRLHDRKTEHFKALTEVGHASAGSDQSISTGHKIKWDHFEILESGKSDLQCKIKETLGLKNIPLMKTSVVKNSFFINSHRILLVLLI